MVMLPPPAPTLLRLQAEGSVNYSDQQHSHILCFEGDVNAAPDADAALCWCSQDLRIELGSRTNIIWAVSTGDDFSYHGPEHRGNAGEYFALGARECLSPAILVT
jgi:hypothetical protein